MFKATFIVSALALLGSAISFFNQVLLAWAFGAGPDMDSFLLAASAPATIAGLAAGVLGYQLIPVLQKERLASGSAGALLRGLVLVLGGSAILLAAAGASAADVYITLIAPRMTFAQHQLTVELARLAWMGMPLAVVGAVYTAGMHITRRFYLVAMLQSAPVVGAIGLLLLFRQTMGIYAPVVGQVAGYAIAATILHVSANLGNQGVFPGARIAAVVRQFPLALAGIAIFVLYPVSDAIWGMRIGPAAVSYLGYAQRLLVGFSGIVVVGATTVLFPKFSEMAAAGDEHGMLQTLGRSMRAMLVCMAPAATFIAGAASPIISVLFGRGAFGPAAIHGVSAILPVMLVGMVAMSCGGLVFKALFASGRIRSAALISSFGALLYFVLSGWLASAHGLHGIAVAYALTWWCVVTGGTLVLWPCAGWLDCGRRLAGFSLRVGFGCVIAGAIGAGCSHTYAGIGSPGGAAGLGFLFLAGTLAAGAYLAIGAGVMKIAEARLVIEYAWQRIRGLTGATRPGHA